MKFFIADKELQSPIVEAVCGVVENKEPKLLHSVEDDNVEQFVQGCVDVGITHSNISAYAALHLIAY